MYLEVRNATGSGEIAVREHDDCTKLHVVAPESTTEAALGALLEERGWGRQGAAGHVWLDIETLRRQAGPGGRDGWSSRFNTMIEYARSKGWCDPQGTHVAAHIQAS